MGFADKRTWEKTRPDVCKASGMGRACDSWKSACYEPEKVAADDKWPEAKKAVDSMLAAITAARGSLRNAKKGDSKVENTNALLDEWEREARSYWEKLKVATKKDAEEKSKAEFEEKKEKAREGYLAILADNEKILSVVVPKLLADAEKLVKQGDGNAAETAIQKVHGQLKNINGGVTRPDPIIKVEEGKAGLKPGVLSAREFSSQLNSAKAAIKSLYKRVDELEEAADKLGDGAEPDTANQDAAYKRKFEEVRKGYIEVLKGITQHVGEAKKLLMRCEAYNRGPAGSKSLESMVKVASHHHSEFVKLKEASANALFDIRESGGAVVKLRKEAGLEADDIKALTPYMTKGMALNSRVIAASVKGATELREGLEKIAAGPNAEAAKAARALLAEI